MRPKFQAKPAQNKPETESQPGKELFHKAVPSSKRRIVMSLAAKDKRGKTHWALTAPGPLLIVNFDFGGEGVIEKFLPPKGTKRADVCDLVTPTTEKEAKETYKTFLRAYNYALSAPLTTHRTIIIDTGTALWETIRLSELGALKAMPSHYSAVNPLFSKIIQQALLGDKNLIILHRMKEVWENSKPSGKFAFAGFKGVPYDVQLTCEMFRTDPDDGDDFNIRINECRFDPKLKGRTLPKPLCNFPTLASMVLPETTPADWRENEE